MFGIVSPNAARDQISLEASKAFRMAREDGIRIHVVQEPSVVDAFVAPLARSPLAGGLGRVWRWRPAEDAANFPPTDVTDADFILVPVAVGCLEAIEWPKYGGLSERGCLLARAVIDDALADAVASLHHFAHHPDRIVYLQSGDYADPFGPLATGVVAKVSARRDVPRCIVLPYYLEECGWLRDQFGARPLELCTEDFGFLGDLDNGPLRRALPGVVGPLRRRGYSCTIESVGYHERQDFDRRRYIDALVKSRFILCPRGIGLNSLRFFEALAFGRVPVLIADEARLPLDWLIDWDTFVVRVPEAQLGRIPDHVDAFLARTSLAEAAARARRVYEDYLTLAHAGALFRESLAYLERGPAYHG